MARRIKLIFSDSDLIFKLPQEDVTYNLNVTSTEIQFKISIEDNFSEPYASWTYLNCTLNLDTVKNMNRFHSNMLVGVGFASNEFLMEQKEEHRIVGNANLVDISAFSKTKRIQNIASKRLATAPIRLFIYVRDPKDTFEDWDILVHVPAKNHTFITNVLQWEGPVELTEFNHAIELPDAITSEEDTSYNNPDYYKFKVFAPAYNTELEAEPCVGVIDRARIYMKDGEGSIRVLKSSVESGDKIIAKVGFGNYVRLHSIEKQL